MFDNIFNKNIKGHTCSSSSRLSSTSMASSLSRSPSIDRSLMLADPMITRQSSTIISLLCIYTSSLVWNYNDHWCYPMITQWSSIIINLLCISTSSLVWNYKLINDVGQFHHQMMIIHHHPLTAYIHKLAVWNYMMNIDVTWWWHEGHAQSSDVQMYGCTEGWAAMQ